jgi:formate dehydrogenase iron-sulfur subunit
MKSEAKTSYDRRSFLEMLGIGALGASALAIPQLAHAEGTKSGRVGILFDSSKCIGCHYCEGACRKAHGLDCDVVYNISAFADTIYPKNVLPYEMVQETRYSGVIANDDRTAERWLRVVQVERDDGTTVSIRHSCTHCGLCAKVCPARALVQRDDGVVEVHSERCIGCYYCYQACPYDIPRFREGDDEPDLSMQKCTLCAEITAEGGTPACVEACPAGAILYGPIEDVIYTGQLSVEELKKAGNPNAQLYGATENGGTGLVYVLPDSPKSVGLPKV